MTRRARDSNPRRKGGPLRNGLQVVGAHAADQQERPILATHPPIHHWSRVPLVRHGTVPEREPGSALISQLAGQLRLGDLAHQTRWLSSHSATAPTGACRSPHSQEPGWSWSAPSRSSWSGFAVADRVHDLGRHVATVGDGAVDGDTARRELLGRGGTCTCEGGSSLHAPTARPIRIAVPGRAPQDQAMRDR